MFDAPAARVRAALGAAALGLEHVGSTAVPGLPAKPAIDINLTVAGSAREEAYAPRLEAAFALAHREPRGATHAANHDPGRGSEPGICRSPGRD